MSDTPRVGFNKATFVVPTRTTSDQKHAGFKADTDESDVPDNDAVPNKAMSDKQSVTHPPVSKDTKDSDPADKFAISTGTMSGRYVSLKAGTEEPDVTVPTKDTTDSRQTDRYEKASASLKTLWQKLADAIGEGKSSKPSKLTVPEIEFNTGHKPTVGHSKMINILGRAMSSATSAASDSLSIYGTDEPDSSVGDHVSTVSSDEGFDSVDGSSRGGALPSDRASRGIRSLSPCVVDLSEKHSEYGHSLIEPAALYMSQKLSDYAMPSEETTGNIDVPDGGAVPSSVALESSLADANHAHEMIGRQILDSDSVVNLGVVRQTRKVIVHIRPGTQDAIRVRVKQLLADRKIGMLENVFEYEEVCDVSFTFAMMVGAEDDMEVTQSSKLESGAKILQGQTRMMKTITNVFKEKPSSGNEAYFCTAAHGVSSGIHTSDVFYSGNDDAVGVETQKCLNLEQEACAMDLMMVKVNDGWHNEISTSVLGPDGSSTRQVAGYYNPNKESHQEDDPKIYMVGGLPNHIGEIEVTRFMSKDVININGGIVVSGIQPQDGASGSLIATLPDHQRSCNAVSYYIGELSMRKSSNGALVKLHLTLPLQPAMEELERKSGKMFDFPINRQTESLPCATSSVSPTRGIPYTGKITTTNRSFDSGFSSPGPAGDAGVIINYNPEIVQPSFCRPRKRAPETSLEEDLNPKRPKCD